MKRHLAIVTTLLLLLAGTPAHAADATLQTSDIVAYEHSLDQLNAPLTAQQIADLNWQLTRLAYGEKPASMTEADYVTALMTFVVEETDTWLERLQPYDGWTAEQIMAATP